MRIARIKPPFYPVPPEGYGGTQRVMAQISALQAATCGHDISLYASSDSKIIEYTRSIAEDLGLTYMVSEKEQSIHIKNNDGRWGSLTLRTIGKPHTQDNATMEQDRPALFNLLIQDAREGAEHGNPFDIISVHEMRCTGILAEAGLDNVLAHEHTDRKPPGASTRFSPEYYQTMKPVITDDDEFGSACPVIALSQAHADDLSQIQGVEILGYAHHGIYQKGWKLHEESAGYLLSIGRFMEGKGAHRAIEIAKRSGKPLIISGSVSSGSQKYFDEQIGPHITIRDETLPDRMKGKSAQAVRALIKELEDEFRLSHPDNHDPVVIFVGETTDTQKKRLYGNADATLTPISLRESMGLTSIESMATGTPVIAYAQLGDKTTGATNEVIDEGVTGFKVFARTEEEAVEKAVGFVGRLGEISRTGVREVFDRKWTAENEIMALERLYAKFLEKSQGTSLPDSIVQAAQILRLPAQENHRRV